MSDLTITGNLTADPELRLTPSGQPVATFRVASTPRYRDNQSGEWKDGETLFLACVAWRQIAENVAESLQRGMRVIVTGKLKQRSYETKEGEERRCMRSRSTTSARRCATPQPRSTAWPGPAGRRLRRRSARPGQRPARGGQGGGFGGEGGGGAEPTRGQSACGRILRRAAILIRSPKARLTRASACPQSAVASSPATSPAGPTRRLSGLGASLVLG